MKVTGSTSFLFLQCDIIGLCRRCVNLACKQFKHFTFFGAILIFATLLVLRLIIYLLTQSIQRLQFHFYQGKLNSRFILVDKLLSYNLHTLVIVLNSLAAL